MADRYFSVVLGEQLPVQVTKGSSSSSEAIELRVNDTLFGNKLAVILGVRALLNYLETREKNPIA